MPTSTDRTGEVFGAVTPVRGPWSSVGPGEAWTFVGGPAFGGITSITGVGTMSMTANWSALPGVVYELCWATTAGGCTGANFTPMQTTVAGASSATITGLIQSTRYYVCVRARAAS